jgi:hypothetical protein
MNDMPLNYTIAAQLLNKRAASRFTGLEMSEYTTNELHDANIHKSDKQPLNTKCGNAVRKRLRCKHCMALSMCQCPRALGDRVEDLLETLAVDGDILNKNMSSGGPLHNAVHNGGPMDMLIKAARYSMLSQAVARYTMLFTMVVRCTCLSKLPATQCCPKRWPAALYTINPRHNAAPSGGPLHTPQRWPATNSATQTKYR